MTDVSPSDVVEDVGGSGTTEATAESTTADHAAAEGVEPSDNLGSTSSLREMMMSTDPSPPLDAVESPWDPDRGGPTRMMRGLKKMTGADGIPAVVDVAIGVVEFVVGEDLLAGDGDGSGVEDAAEPPARGGPV